MSHRATILAATAAVAALASAGAAMLASRPNAHRLFEQGLEVGRQDPVAGERRFRDAITAASGRFPDAQFALCHALARQGLWDEALSLFANVDPQACRADLLLAFGRDALQAGHRPEGLQALHAASQRGLQASVTALELLMDDYRDWGQGDEEAAATRLLARLEPGNPRHWKRLIEMLLAKRDAAETENALREALAHEPAEEFRRDFEYILAGHLLARGEVDEARRRIAALKEFEGPSFRVTVSEIGIYRIEGRFDLAVETATALSTDVRNMPALYEIRGVAHLDVDQYEQAARNLERAVAARPHNEKAHFWLAEAYRGLGRGEPAGRHAKIAAEITAKRDQLNNALERKSHDRCDKPTCERLASLFEDLGEGTAARVWRDRANRISQGRISQGRISQGRISQGQSKSAEGLSGGRHDEK